MSVKIRRMRRLDAVAVARMMKKLSAFHGDTTSTTAKDFVKHCLGPRKRGQVWLAFYNGKPAGFVYAFDAYDFVINGFKRDLNLLYVDSAYRRKGIGEALVACVAKDALKKKCILVFVKAISNNKTANSFYKSIGMSKKIAARHKTKYIAKDHALTRLAGRQ